MKKQVFQVKTTKPALPKFLKVWAVDHLLKNFKGFLKSILFFVPCKTRIGTSGCAYLGLKTTALFISYGSSSTEASQA